MTTFTNLPSDITMTIAKFQHSDVSGLVSDWKYTLRILSICRSWRATMLPVIYATVFIVIPEDLLSSCQSTIWRLPSNYKAPYTNAGLIYENGCGFLVKRIFILTLSTCHTPFPWFYVAEALGVDEDEFPGILAVRNCIETDTKAKYRIASQNSVCKAFDSVAHVLALRFPNVSSLGINTDGCSSSMQTDVLNKLVGAYASQLVKIDLNDFNINPELLNVANIRYFDNYLFDDFQGVPFINPTSLIFLKLHSCSNKFIWNQFVCGKDTDTIEFTNLERLQLSSNNPIANVLPDAKRWHLRFPKLTRLKVGCDMLTNREFQPMAMNLKTLDYSGSGDSAVELFENNIGGLERLNLDLPLYIEDEHDYKRFISQTNKIFGMVGPIPEISCMGLEAHNLRMSSIYWPNLTWLELTTSIEPFKFLRSIDRIPHLLHLRLIMINSPNEADEIEDSDNAGDEKYYHRDMYAELSCHSYIELSRLSYLKRSGGSQPKLTTLTIQWFTHDAYDWHLKNVVLESIIDEDPGLEAFFKRQPRRQAKRMSSANSNYDCRYDTSNDCRVINGPNCENLLEDTEAEAALRAYFPSLVIIKFTYMTRDCCSDDMNSW